MEGASNDREAFHKIIFSYLPLFFMFASDREISCTQGLHSVYDQEEATSRASKL